MTLPARRDRPRRTQHPVQPAWATDSTDTPDDPPAPTRRPRSGLPAQRATPRRTVHPVQPDGPTPPPADDPTPSDFRQRVLDATMPRGRCQGTPGCRYSGPHEGHQAHHIHLRSRGGSDHTLNGAWLCNDGHAWVHAHPADATRLGLMATTSPPWPDPDY